MKLLFLGIAIVTISVILKIILKNNECCEKKKKIIPYENYEAYLDSINPYTINISSAKNRSLTNMDKQFLKYMSCNKTVEHLNVARYWYYTYGIDVKEEIRLFLKLNLLEVKKEVNLESYKVSELKKFLESNSYPKTGNKDDLIKRIQENFTLDDIKNFFEEKSYYRLTEKGEKIIDSIPPSSSINSDMETECINLILKEKYDEAYNIVCNFKISSPISSGMNYEWKAEKKCGWNKRKLDKTSEKNKIYSSCLIYCDMAGISYQKASAIYKNITNEEYDLTEQDISNSSVEQYLFYRSNKMELDEYRKCDIKKYKILGCCDTKTCKKCAHMDGKVFNVSEAIIGVNAPPFEYDCRCTTTAITEDSSDFEKKITRRIKNEKGKSIVVPFINYEEWSKKYAPEKYREYFVEK